MIAGLFHEAGQNLIFTAAVVSAAIALLLAIGKVWKLFRKVNTFIDYLVLIPKLVKDLEDVRREVKPNGGSSLKDQVTAISKEMEKHHKNVGMKLRRMDNRIQKIEDSK